MVDPCPRCGSSRQRLAPCPECGYEPAHPGVLGSYVDAARGLWSRPQLVLPFLLPTAVLLVTQIGLTGIREPGAVAGAADAVSGLAGLLLQVAWYLVAVGWATRPALDPEAGFAVPATPIAAAGLLGGLVVVAPWILVAAVLVTQPTGALGGLALLASIVLLIAAVFAAGRAVGLPVEAALEGTTGLELLRGGSRRARENGGLGLVFLGVLLLGSLTLVPGVLAGISQLQVHPNALLAAGTLTSWVLGAWIGVALAIGLAGHAPGPEATFRCPRCSAEAVVREGRARCECGLEGPYYEAPRGPGGP